MGGSDTQRKKYLSVNLYGLHLRILIAPNMKNFFGK